MTSGSHAIPPERPLSPVAATRRGARFWPWFVVSLLFVHVAGVVTLIALATGDPSVQLEEDYYAKGLAWDQRMAQDRENVRLGWQSEVALQPLGPEKVYVQVRLEGRRGEPIDGATLSLETFHKARAGEKIRSSLRAIGPGSYATILPLRRAGLWEIRLEARRGAERYAERFDRELRTSAPGQLGAVAAPVDGQR